MYFGIASYWMKNGAKIRGVSVEPAVIGVEHLYLIVDDAVVQVFDIFFPDDMYYHIDRERATVGGSFGGASSLKCCIKILVERRVFFPDDVGKDFISAENGKRRGLRMQGCNAKEEQGEQAFFHKFGKIGE